MDLFGDDSGIVLRVPRDGAVLGMSDRQRAARWAQQRLQAEDYVILDTETTGLGADAQVVQIGVLSADGMVLLDVAIKPDEPIPPDASMIHSITDGMVAGAATFRDVYLALCAVLRNKVVVVYNADYDKRILDQTCERFGLAPVTETPGVDWQCAMLWYSAYVGERRHNGQYKWQKLPALDLHAAHSAIGDCRSTRGVMEFLAAAVEG